MPRLFGSFLTSLAPACCFSHCRLMSTLKRSRKTAVRRDPLTEMFSRTSAQISEVNGSRLKTAPRNSWGAPTLSPRDPSKGYITLLLQAMYLTRGPPVSILNRGPRLA